jgi:hypothetical protein
MWHGRDALGPWARGVQGRGRGTGGIGPEGVRTQAGFGFACSATFVADSLAVTTLAVSSYAREGSNGGGR